MPHIRRRQALAQSQPARLRQSVSLGRAAARVSRLLLVVFTAGCGSLAPGVSAICAPEPRGTIANDTPRSVADDGLAVEGEAVSVTGRFGGARTPICAYAKQAGSGWALRGHESSDALGWVSVPLGSFATAGDYSVRLETSEAGTGAEATIFVRPRGTRLAVFDVDGTLTAGELMPALLGGPQAEPRPFGRELAETLRNRGCLIVYLTARPYEMTDTTRRWRELWNFPRGVVHVSRSPLGLRGRAAAEFKRNYLEEVRGRDEAGGRRFIADFAFGNMPSDLSAYSAVYPRASIYLMDYHPRGIEPKPSSDYQIVEHTWETVVRDLERLPAPGQPTRCR